MPSTGMVATPRSCHCPTAASAATRTSRSATSTTTRSPPRSPRSWPRRTSTDRQASPATHSTQTAPTTGATSKGESMTDTQSDVTGPVLDYRENPFGLVYEYAITANEPGKVNIHPVGYPLHGLTIAANVYTPADYDPNGAFPAITVAHPNGGT